MALFSKKHYHALRDALRQSVHKYDATNKDQDSQMEFCVSIVADMLERDNPAFERQRFITEIYVPEHRSQE